MEHIFQAAEAPRPTGLTVYRYHLPLRRRFEHAAASREVNEGILTRLELADGSIGIGEGIPRPYVTGETVESALEVIRGEYARRLASERPLEGGPLPGSALGVWHNAAWCACELAYLDAVAHSAHMPLAEMLGWKLNRPVSHVIAPRVAGVIGAEKPEAVTRQVRLMRLFGLRDFKLKVGGSADHTNLHICSRALGKSLRRGRSSLRVDANGVWSLEKARRAMEWMVPLGVSVVEQPLGKGNDADLPELRAASGAKIMVDESLVSTDDARTLLGAGAADAWNLRVTKNGGLLATLVLADLAAAHGIDVMLGALVGESGILSAAARVVLQLAPGVRWLENSYGSFLLSRDLVRERTRFGFGGRLRPLRGVGLGVTLSESALADLAERVDVISLR